MRFGFTTGSCAAAAAKAAAYMLLTGKKKDTISIETPKGILFTACIQEIEKTEGVVSCAVEKDSGDDPDVTNHALIFARVSIEEDARERMDSNLSKDAVRIIIDGGFGVGRVTKPGLDQPVGNAAINHVPRQMIEKEVLEICVLTDFKGKLRVEISVPKGIELAQKTFNPRLGIVGGISILGTSGIVEPMSMQALIDTIKVELNQKKAQGAQVAAVSPGNYGLDYMKAAYGYDLDKSVKCSNFIGDTIDIAADLGFEKLLLTGHIGKMIKVAGGIMNTHSKEGDCRMEIMVSAALKCGVKEQSLRKILDCVTTEEALHILDMEQKREDVMKYLMEKIQFYLNKRAANRIKIETIVYSNEYGELGKSIGAQEILDELLKKRSVKGR